MLLNNSAIYLSKILIVDDNDNNAATLKEMLELAGFEDVMTLLDARNALATIKTHEPNLVILDLHMPYFSGLQLLQLMKTNSLLNDKLDVIMLTGDSDMTHKVNALSLGASDFITKPFSFLEVKTRIENLLHKNLLYTQLENQNQLLAERVQERTAALLHINDTLLAQNEKLKKINWMQSHVIRAPLARFLGIANLLIHDDSLCREEYKKLIENSVEAAHEVDKVIKDVSDLAWESQLLGNAHRETAPTTETSWAVNANLIKKHAFHLNFGELILFSSLSNTF